LPEEINGLVGKMTSPLIILGYHICQVHFKPFHLEHIQTPMETSPMIPTQKIICQVHLIWMISDCNDALFVGSNVLICLLVLNI
jgi:hypothetical protein